MASAFDGRQSGRESDAQAGGAQRLSNLVRGRNLAAQFLRELVPEAAPAPERARVRAIAGSRSSASGTSSARSEVVDLSGSATGGRGSQTPPSGGKYEPGTPASAAEPVPEPLVEPAPTVEQFIQNQEEKARQIRRINQRFEEGMQAQLRSLFLTWKRSATEESTGRHPAASPPTYALDLPPRGPRHGVVGRSLEESRVGAAVGTDDSSNLQVLYRRRACLLATRVAEWLTIERCKFLVHALLTLWKHAVVASAGADASEIPQMQEELLRLQQYLVRHFMWWIRRQELAEVSFAFRAWYAASRPASPQIQAAVATPETPSRRVGRRSTVTQQVAAWSLQRSMQGCLEGWKEHFLKNDDFSYKRQVVLVWLLVAVTEQRVRVTQRLIQRKQAAVAGRCRDVAVVFLKLLLNSWRYEAQASRLRFFRQGSVQQAAYRANLRSDLSCISFFWHQWMVQLFDARVQSKGLKVIMVGWRGYVLRRRTLAFAVSWRPLNFWRRNFDAGLLPSAWYWWLRASILGPHGHLRPLWHILRWQQGSQEASYQSAGFMPRAASHDRGVVQQVIAMDFARLRSCLVLWRVAASILRVRQKLFADQLQHASARYVRHSLELVLHHWAAAVTRSAHFGEQSLLQAQCDSLQRKQEVRAQKLTGLYIGHYLMMLTAECFFVWYRFAKSRWGERLSQKVVNLQKWLQLTVSTAQAQTFKKDLSLFVFGLWRQETLRSNVQNLREKLPVLSSKAAWSKALMTQQLSEINSLIMSWCLRSWRRHLGEVNLVAERRVLHKRRTSILANIIDGCLSATVIMTMQSCWDIWSGAVHSSASERRDSRIHAVMRTMPRLQRCIGAEWVTVIAGREQLFQWVGTVFNAWASASASGQAQEDSRCLRKKYWKVSDKLSKSLLVAYGEGLASVVLNAWANETTKNCSMKLMLRLRRGALWAVARLGVESTKQVAREAFQAWAGAVIAGSGDRAKELSQHLQSQAHWVLERSARAREHRHTSAVALAEALSGARESAWLCTVLTRWHHSAADSRAAVLQNWIYDLEKQLASQARELQIQEALSSSRGKQSEVDSVTLASNLQQMLADVRQEADMQRDKCTEQRIQIQELERQLAEVRPTEDGSLLEELQQRLANASMWESTLRGQRADLEQQVMSARVVSEGQPMEALALESTTTEAILQRQQSDVSVRQQRIDSLELQLSDACAQETMLRGQVADLKQQLESALVLAKAGTESHGEPQSSRSVTIELEQQLMDARELQAQYEQRHGHLSARAANLEEELSSMSARVPMLQTLQEQSPGVQSPGMSLEASDHTLANILPEEGATESHNTYMSGRSGMLSARMTGRSGSFSARVTGRSGLSWDFFTPVLPEHMLGQQPIPSARSMDKNSSAAGMTAREEQEDHEAQRLQDLLNEMEEQRCVIRSHERLHAEEIRQTKSSFMTLCGKLVELVSNYWTDNLQLNVAFQAWGIAAHEANLSAAQGKLSKESQRVHATLAVCLVQVSISSQRGYALRCLIAWTLSAKGLRQVRVVMARLARRFQRALMLRCFGGWRHALVHELDVKDAQGLTKNVLEKRRQDFKQKAALWISGNQHVVFVAWAAHVVRRLSRTRSARGAQNLIGLTDRARVRAAWLVWQRVHAESRCNGATAEQISAMSEEVHALQAAGEVSKKHQILAARHVAVRMYMQRSRGFATACLEYWARGIMYRRARESSALHATTLFDGWARANSAVLLKSVMCVWIDVIIVVQTAALRLGIRQTATALEVDIDPQVQWKKKKSVYSLGPPSMSISEERTLAVAAVTKWRGVVSQKKNLDGLVSLVWRAAATIDEQSLLQAVWAAWRISAINRSKSMAALDTRSIGRATRSRCASASLWALEMAAEREELLISVVSLVRAWRAWSHFSRESTSSNDQLPKPMLQRDDASAVERVEEHCQILVGVTLALWSQEQQRSLARTTFALWFWSAGCLTLQAHVERLRHEFGDVQYMADRASLVIEQNARNMLRRWETDSLQTVMSKCFMAWHKLLSASGQVMGSSYKSLTHIKQLQITHASAAVESWRRSGERGLLQVCLFRWREAFLSSGYARREDERDRQVRLMSYSNATKLLQRSGMAPTSTSKLWTSFLHWRLSCVGTLRQRQKDDLAMMVELLQQSTTTCKELQSCLLVQRRDAAYAAFFALRSVFQAWRSCLRPGIGAGRA